jgi:hypothetical protein
MLSFFDWVSDHNTVSSFGFLAHEQIQRVLGSDQYGGVFWTIIECNECNVMHLDHQSIGGYGNDA